MIALPLLLLLACDDGAVRRVDDPPRDDTDADADSDSDTDADTIGPFSWQNPVFADDFPDPFVVRGDDGWYAFATNTGWGNVPTARSDDLATFTAVGDAMPTLPDWAASGQSLTWAPGVLRRGDLWVLYFTARYTAAGLQCIGAATATAPQGPYTDAIGAPFVCQTDFGGSIDPYPFVDPDGDAWLLWKNDGNCCGLSVGLWAQPLAADGLSLTGSPAEILRYDEAWEDPLIENPAMWAHEGRFHLLYSANWWESSGYCVGWAVCETPAGPCVKHRSGPIFQSTDTVAGPGGQALFADDAGRVWLAYHAWTPPADTYGEGGARSLRLDPVTFDGDTLTIAGPSVDPQTVP